MQYLKYKGEFLSRNNTVCSVEIYREAAAAYDLIGKLQFPSDEPVVIEWAHSDKEESLCGSVADVTIISPGDRTYEDLYTITPGDITLKIYRNGSLYWSGTLDPEFYEEPYSSGSEYEVTLTFSDFGILNRMKFNMEGMQSMQDILNDALQRAKLGHCSPVRPYISTCMKGNAIPVTLSDLSLRADNFYDEDGEALSMYEVLEGMLQPLGLRMVQQAGEVYVYDLNALYQKVGTEQVRWESTDQHMGTDKVANNVKITFSPYSDARLLAGDLKYGGDKTENTGIQPDGSNCYKYLPNYKKPEDYDWDYSDISFLMYVGSKGTGTSSSSYKRYFEIAPILGGSKSTGVAYFFYTGYGSLSSGVPKPIGTPPSTRNDTPVIKTEKIYLPAIGADETAHSLLRLQLGILIDARYNPFSDADGDNEKGNYNAILNDAGYLYLPFRAVIYDNVGNVLCHYANKYETTKTYLEPHMKYTTGKWVDGAPAEWDEAVLAYYNTDDPGGTLQSLGWRTNRQTLMRNKKFIMRRPSWLKVNDGQYMAYPPVSGYLEISILTGMRTCKTFLWSSREDSNDIVLETDITSRVRWMLYKLPALSVVRTNSVFEEYSSDDVEYTGVLNENAKDNIKIDTICGTMEEVNPVARGAYHQTSTGLQITEMTRAGRTTQVEHLLIGTLYSQYAERKTVLSGTTRLTGGGLKSCTDANQEDKRFIVLQDVQDLIADERELKMVELRPDEYEEK